jgi:hypothetical protein
MPGPLALGGESQSFENNVNVTFMASVDIGPDARRWILPILVGIEHMFYYRARSKVLP